MWEKRSLATALPKEFKQVERASAILGKKVSAFSDSLEDVVNVVKVLNDVIIDPFGAFGFQGLLDELRREINSVMSLGMYVLNVFPDNVDNPRYNIKTFAAGMTPYEAIERAVLSFDDRGDDDRPMFSDSEEVQGACIMLSAASVEDFVRQLGDFSKIFNLSGFVRIYERYKNFTKLDEIKYSSTKPDWEQFTLRKLPLFSQIDTKLVEFISLLDGYVVQAGDALTDFTNTLLAKVNLLDRSITGLNDALSVLTRGLFASGVYWKDIKRSTGGNRYLKKEIQEGLSVFSDNPNLEYTVMLVLVSNASGEGDNAVSFLRKLLL